MKISELTEKLNEIKNQHGDILVGISHEWLDELTTVEYEPFYKYSPNLLGVCTVKNECVVLSGGGDGIFYKVDKEGNKIDENSSSS